MKYNIFDSPLLPLVFSFLVFGYACNEIYFYQLAGWLLAGMTVGNLAISLKMSS